MTSTQRRVDRAVKVGISQATSRVQGAAADAADEGASGQSVTNHAFAKGSCEDATPFAAEGMFEVIGFDAAEERAYVTLLQHPGLTAAQLARHLTVSNWHAEGLVRELEAKGMVSRESGFPTRYKPVSPDVAVGALIAAQESRLYRARLAAERLRELESQVTSRQAYGNDLLEVIIGRKAVARRCNQLHAAAKQEVAGFRQPPCGDTLESSLSEFAAVARGVAYRMVHDGAWLEHPGGMDSLRLCAEAGQQVRIFSPLPLTLIVFDRRTALIPQSDPQEREITNALLVRSSTLVDAFVVFFENVWHRSTPLMLTPSARRITTNAEETEAQVLSGAAGVEADVIALLAAGLKGGAVARRLGVSPRTVDRRISGSVP